MASILDYRRDVAVRPRLRIAWTTEVGELLLVEPTLEEVAAHAAELATAYNDPANAPLMGHDEVLASEDVVEHYRGIRDSGGTPFLLYLDGILVGDADLRGFRRGAAEFAFLIAAHGLQGKGLGTRLALMVHACAFAALGLERVYASIDPANPASRRALEKIGYRPSESEEARSFADGPGDLVLILDRAPFLGSHAEVIARLRFGV
jgi:RimJ/RimL family protein N-acetyltransferase